MILNIIKISRKPKTTQYGEKTSVGLLTTEYGEQWLNGWGDNNNASWQPGMTVEATVEQKDKWLNFKAIPPSVAPNAISTTPRAFNAPQALKTPQNAFKQSYSQPEQPNWTEISKGKVRHGVAIELIKKDFPLNPDTDKLIKQWTDYIMSGELPKTPAQELGIDENLGFDPNQAFPD
jgi:hypothetical protein